MGSKTGKLTQYFVGKAFTERCNHHRENIL